MKKTFVKTSNYKAFRSGISIVEGRGAAEASMLLVTGAAGFGKSETVEQWSIEAGAAHLRAKVEWTPHYFMTELAENLRVDARGRAKDIFARVAARLVADQTPLVIDEIDHCMRDNAAVLETARDLSDLTEVIVVLVGMDQVQSKLSRHAQISSRIAHVVEFQPATLDDVKLTCRELSEVLIADNLVAEIHRAATGRMREVVNAIAVVESHARRNGLKTVTCADLAGKTLVYDWLARRPRHVRQAKPLMEAVK